MSTNWCSGSSSCLAPVSPARSGEHLGAGTGHPAKTDESGGRAGRHIAAQLLMKSGLEICLTTMGNKSSQKRCGKPGELIGQSRLSNRSLAGEAPSHHLEHCPEGAEVMAFLGLSSPFLMVELPGQIQNRDEQGALGGIISTLNFLESRLSLQ